MPLSCVREYVRRCTLYALAIACAITTACATTPEPQPLRIMTYNIAAGRGDLDAIADVIRTAAADIVALQEVDVHWSERSGFADQATALGAALGMHVRFGPIYSLPGDTGPPREFGLAILSRHRIVEFTNHVIPRLSTQTAATGPEPLPGFLEAVIDVRGTRLRVFNTHLDYRADPRVRVQQAAAMLAIVEAGTVPLILAGDLNARPDAAELEPLLTRFTDAWSDGAGARQTRVARGTTRGGDTPAGGETYPADTPDRRIDYILLSDDVRVVHVQVPAALASDHRPVVADVLLPRPGARN